MVEKPDRLILPVAGGKGGAGKSVFVTNLGQAAARLGVKTLLVDLDLGGSNLHTLIGQKNILPGLGMMLVEKGIKMDTVVHPTPWPDLSYLPGDNQVPRAANLLPAQKQKIIRELKGDGFDVTICDLGAGASLNTTDFFLTSPHGILVFTPEITSLLNAYSFLRNTFFRALSKLLAGNQYAKEVLNDYRASPVGPKSWSVERLRQELADRAPGQEKRVEQLLGWFRPGLVINLVQNKNDLKAMERLAGLIRDKLSLDSVRLGALPYDPAVPASVRKRQPAYGLFPDSPFAEAIHETAGRILSWRDEPLGALASGLRFASPAAGMTAAPVDAEQGRDILELMSEMLPVVDDLTRAQSAAQDSGQEAMAKGIETTLKAHLARLSRFGLSPITALGQPFDPNLHQAVAVDRESGQAKGMIVAEVKKGFYLKGRLFRAAEVVVAE